MTEQREYIEGLRKEFIISAYVGYAFTVVLITFLVVFDIAWGILVWMMLLLPIPYAYFLPMIFFHLTRDNKYYEDWIYELESHEKIYKIKQKSGFNEYNFITDGITISVPRSKLICENMKRRIIIKAKEGKADQKVSQINLRIFMVDEKLNLPYFIEVSRRGNLFNPEAAKFEISYFVWNSAEFFSASLIEICPEKFDEIDFDSYTYLDEIGGDREFMAFSRVQS